jgi:uncharacterized membrane protein
MQKEALMTSEITSDGSALGRIALAVKTTLTGGLVFLLPLGLFLLVFSEITDLFLNIAEPIASRLPQEDWLGIAANNVIAWGIVLLVCYGAGLIARFATISKYSEKIDSILDGLIPGYNVIASKVTGLVGSDSFEERLIPVVVKMGAVSRFGLESSRSQEDGTVMVFLPGTPDPMSGIVVCVPADQVAPANIGANIMLDALRRGGMGLGD